MQNKWIKTAGVIVGAVFFSTLGIFASDTLRGIDGSISNIASVKGVNGCARGMARLSTKNGDLCVDIYEASPAQSCPHRVLTNTLETEANLNTETCNPESMSGGEPWRYVSLPQAQRLCSRTGKRLPTSAEWYEFAIGTRAEACVVDGVSAEETGARECVSDRGIYDAVGNVWEWVDAQVVDGAYEGRALPAEGYVTSVDASGVALTIADTSDLLYGEDYFWSKPTGVFGMLRGGFYGSNADAGIYTVNASVPTNFATQGVGFRCVANPVS